MTPSSKSATEGGAANAGTAVNADATPVKRYSLFTAICLIVGICIGSGIFFKSDNILIATDGNVALGVAMMLLAATTIVFGGLTLARFAARTTGHGGLIAYAEEFLGPRRAAAPAIALASSLAIGLSSISDPTRWPFVVAFTALLLVMTFALTPKRDA